MAKTLLCSEISLTQTLRGPKEKLNLLKVQNALHKSNKFLSALIKRFIFKD